MISATLYNSSMYRDTYTGCPACGAALATDAGPGAVRRCDGCAGVWVPEALVVEMMRKMTNNEELGLLPFEARVDATSVRSCPECGRLMMTGLLEQITVERCPKSHGYWFDAFELEAALFRAGRRVS
jgi:Zn-finger nucleic acid-binding protein